MKSNYKTGSPFPRLNTPDLYDKKDFDERINQTNEKNRQALIDLAGYRGKDTYNEVTSNTPRAPYVKNQGFDKKFPYLSSKHHAGRVFNPMQSDIRDRNAMTIAEERKAEQDRMLGGSFVDERQGTRGSTYFGPEFDKKAEKAAKTAVDRHEYLANAAAQGEDALEAALSQENIYNKNNVVIDQEMPVRSKFPISTKEVGVPTNLRGGYAANPSGQSLRNINSFIDLRDRANSAQDLSDFLRQAEVKRQFDSDERMRYFDSFKGLGDRDERTGEYKINFGGQ
jgi:hypothetical protein